MSHRSHTLIVFLRESFMAAANKLPQSHSPISQGSPLWVFLCQCCDAFCTGRKQKKKKGCVETTMCRAASWMSESLLLDRADWTLILSEGAQNFKRVVPSMGFLSENTTQLTSDWFHSGECYQLCIKCGQRAWFSCHTFQAAILPCAVLPCLRQEELHLIFLISVSPFLFFLA